MVAVSPVLVKTTNISNGNTDDKTPWFSVDLAMQLNFPLQKRSNEKDNLLN